MTSKNLFINMLKDNVKRRILFVMLGMLAFFFAFPVSAAMNLSKAMNVKFQYRDLGWNHEAVIDNALMQTFQNNVLISMITCILAIVLGIQGFSYLFSKSRTDLYHALPIRRERLFSVVFLNGIFIYAASYILNLVLSLSIAGIYRLLSMEIILQAIQSLLIHTAFFLLIYSTVVLAVMLTGNLITAILGSMVFLFYVSFIYEIIRSCFGRFFSTSYANHWDSRIRNHLSPVLAYKDNGLHYTDASDLFRKLVFIIAVAAIPAFLSFLLYKKYPSEAAGKSMSFPASKKIIKVFLMVPMALGSGFFFETVNGYEYERLMEGWFLFGLLIGLLLSHAIIETIYEFDIKAGFYKCKQIIIPTVLAAIIYCIFRFDVFGYDNLPQKDQIESVGIALSNTSWLGGTETYQKDENGNFVFYMSEAYIFEHMKYTNMDILYPLLESAFDEDKDTDRREAYYFSVEYRLTNGKKMRRSYSVEKDKNKEKIHQLFARKEFKDGMYPIYSCSDQELSAMRISYFETEEEESIYDMNLSSVVVDGSEEEKQELIQTYKEELYRLDYEDAELDHAVGKLSFQPKGQNYKMYVYLYPEFEETLQLLLSYRRGIE